MIRQHFFFLAAALAGAPLAAGARQHGEPAELEPVAVYADWPAIAEPSAATALLPAAPGGQVATGSQLGILGNRDVLDTPFNLAGYTTKYVEDRQARSIADVAAADPSVRLAFPRASYRDVYSIRGFSLFSYNMGLDGLYGIAPKQRYPAEFVERIEILKGPDTFLNGISLGGSVGGAINIIPKRAGPDPLTTVTARYASDSNFGTHLDHGQRFGTDRAFGIRFNGLAGGGDLAVDGQSEKLGAAALALDYQGERLRLYADFGIQQQKTDAPDWAVTVAPLAASVPAPPSARTSLSQPWAWVRTRDSYGMVRGEYDLADAWTVFGAFGTSTTETTGIVVQPTALQANGDYTAAINAFPSRGEHYSGQVGVRGKFETGPVGHHVVIAAARWQQDLKAVFARLGNYGSNLYRPVAAPRPPVPLPELDDVPRTAEHRYTSLVFADTMALYDERLLLTWGGRWQNIASANYSARTAAQTASYDRSVFSPALAAVYKLTGRLSLYGNYVEALQQGASAPPDAANYGETFAPAVSRQVEAGIKVDWGGWSSSLAAFQITQPSGITDPLTRLYTADGEQRNRGIELNLWGEPVDGLRVLGGIALLDGRQTSTAGDRYDGKRAIGVPSYQGNLDIEWDASFLRNLSLSGRLIVTGKQYANAANTQDIRHWRRVDLGARYRIERTGGQDIVVRLAVENVFGKNYWASAASGQASGISRGSPRTWLLSTTFKF